MPVSVPPRARLKNILGVKRVYFYFFFWGGGGGGGGGGAGIMARARMPLAGVYRRLCSMQRGTRAYFIETGVFASAAG